MKDANRFKMLGTDPPVEHVIEQSERGWKLSQRICRGVCLGGVTWHRTLEEAMLAGVGSGTFFGKNICIHQSNDRRTQSMASEKQNDLDIQIDRWEFWIIAVGLTGAVIVGSGLFLYICFFQQLSGDPQHWGQFSDFVGGLSNPFIALAGFIGIRLTLLYQEKQHQDAEAKRGKSEKTTRLSDLLVRWDSVDMFNAHRSLRHQLQKCDDFDRFVIAATRDGGEDGKNLGMVYTFFARLEMMLEADLLDEVEVKAVLGEEIKEWMGYLPKLSFYVEIDEEDNNWPVKREDLQDLHEWYQRWVDRLSKRFGYAHRVDPQGF